MVGAAFGEAPEVSDERGDPEYITVEVSTLDVEVAKLAPTVVKIDVEGGELGVLEGAPQLLSEVRPIIIFEHVASAAALYGTSSSALWDLLTGVGYRVFSMTGDGPVTRVAFGANKSIVNWLATPDATTAAR